MLSEKYIYEDKFVACFSCISTVYLNDDSSIVRSQTLYHIIGGSPVSPRDLLHGGHSRGISVPVTDGLMTLGGWRSIGRSAL